MTGRAREGYDIQWDGGRAILGKLAIPGGTPPGCEAAGRHVSDVSKTKMGLSAGSGNEVFAGMNVADFEFWSRGLR